MSPSAVTVTPIASPNIGFNFGLNVNTGNGSNITGRLTLSYIVSAAPLNLFNRVLLGQIAGFAGTGNPMVKEQVCLNSVVPGCVNGTMVNLQTLENTQVGLGGQLTASAGVSSATEGGAKQ